jgi:hypothetical protein
MSKTAMAALLAAALAGGAASAATSDFAGAWVNAGPASGIARLAVTAAGDTVTLHVFGPCEQGTCDWGSAPGHGYSLSVTSGDIRIVTADFDLGRRRERLTLCLAPGGLSYRLFTEFADASPRMDYESAGFLKKDTAHP